MSIYYDTEARAIHNVQERIWEALNDAKYELYGPDSFDSDYKKDLRENGEWDDEVARWAEGVQDMTPEDLSYAEGIIEGLEKAFQLCDETIVGGMHRAIKERRQWKANRGERNYLTELEARYQHKIWRKGDI